MIKKLIGKSPKLLKALLSLKKTSPLKMAKYAKENTKIYSLLYKNNNITDFNSLPLLRKTHISIASPYDFLSKKEAKNVAVYGETTGSTGNPTPSFYTEQEFLGSLIMSRISPIYKKLLKGILNKNRVAINGITHGFTIAGHSFGNLLQKNGFLTAHLGTRSSIAMPSRIARAIVRLKPSVIAASPIDFLSWMKIIEKDYSDKYDEVVSTLKSVISTAELCSTSRSRQISHIFDLYHINTYACVEGFFSLPCLCGEKHVLPMYHVEIFDDNVNLIGNEGKGRFAFTNLVRKSTPFVRYLLDDYVNVYKSDCPYGFKKSIQPYGRYELSVVINKKRYGTDHFEEIIFKNGLFGDYRVKIHEDKIELLLEHYKGRINAEKLKADFEKEFKMKTDVVLLTFGELTHYREIRKSKPILKIEDLRKCSTQKLPTFL